MPLYSFEIRNFDITIFENLSLKDDITYISYDICVDGRAFKRTVPRIIKSAQEEKIIRRKLANIIATLHTPIGKIVTKNNNFKSNKQVKFDCKKQVYIYTHNKANYVTERNGMKWFRSLISWIYGYTMTDFKNGKLLIVKEQQKIACQYSLC
jgi:hypothetical protein